MKRIFLIAGVIAMIGLLCSCSDDEPEPAPEPNPDIPENTKKWPDLDYDAIEAELLDSINSGHWWFTQEELSARGLYTMSRRDEDYWKGMMSTEYIEVNLEDNREVTIDVEIPGSIYGMVGSTIYGSYNYIDCPYFLKIDTDCWYFWPHAVALDNVVVEYNNPYEITVRRIGFTTDEAYIVPLVRNTLKLLGSRGGFWGLTPPVYLLVYQSEAGRTWKMQRVKAKMDELIKEWQKDLEYPK